MKNDMVEVIKACIEGNLSDVELEFENNAAVCVILASGGYPLEYQTGYKISGLDKFKDKEDSFVFHAGTAKQDGDFVTNGGRVLGVTAIGNDLSDARIRLIRLLS